MCTCSKRSIFVIWILIQALYSMVKIYGIFCWPKLLKTAQPGNASRYHTAWSMDQDYTAQIRLSQKRIVFMSESTAGVVFKTVCFSFYPERSAACGSGLCRTWTGKPGIDFEREVQSLGIAYDHFCFGKAARLAILESYIQIAYLCRQVIGLAWTMSLQLLLSRSANFACFRSFILNWTMLTSLWSTYL